jgi:hypothetical protein
MAKAPKSTSSSSSSEPEPLYEIKVSRVVTALGLTFRPMHSYVVKGKVLAVLGDAVASSSPVTQD